MIIWRAWRSKSHIDNFLGVYSTMEKAQAACANPRFYEACSQLNWLSYKGDRVNDKHKHTGDGDGMAAACNGWFYVVLPIEVDKPTVEPDEPISNDSLESVIRRIVVDELKNNIRI